MKETHSTISLDNVKSKLGSIVQNIIHIDESELNFELSFRDLGVDSISSVEIVRDINKEFGLNLDAVIIYDYPTLHDFSDYVQRTIDNDNSYIEVMNTGKESTVKQWGLKSTPKESVKVHTETNLKKTVKSKDISITEAEIEDKISQILGKILHLAVEDLQYNMSFKDMGMDSISSVEIIRDVNKLYHMNMDAVITYDYPDISTLSRHIYEQLQHNEIIYEESTDDIRAEEEDTRSAELPKKVTTLKLNRVTPPSKQPEKQKIDAVENKNTVIKPQDIAIIGIAGRFPGAKNVYEFWDNLKNGVDSIIDVPKERWDKDKYYDSNPKTLNKTYSRVSGSLEGYDKFDPLFFNISPLEAEAMDPQQRLFLGAAWNALEDAGYTTESLSGMKCGVFVGAAQSDYGRHMKGSLAENSAEAFVGLSPAVLSARISYVLNLKGPSMSIDTACSSSLIAIHQACRSLQYEESDLAIAGGVRLMFTPEMHIQTSKMEMLSFSGECKTFDNDADGTVLSEGVGAIILKSLDKAIKDKDNIYGIIKGSGVNQDGKTNGITAPSARSQTNLELDVYKRAGINPQDISYVEAHGTGTKLGDPIEVKALKEAFENYTDKKQFCGIGSVKTNIGHATMAAGVISVIKVLLAMKYKLLPPSLHFKDENEHIDFKDTPFYVNTSLKEWKVDEDKKRIAAVSAFGFSGTNCHLVIEEPPKI